MESSNRIRDFFAAHGDLLQLLLLVLVTAVALGVGVEHYPERDVEPTLPGEFMVEVPASITDALGGQAMIEEVTWEEVHALDGPVPVPPEVAEHPYRAADAVRVGLYVTYAGSSLTTEVPITAVVDLPAAAKFLGCASDRKGVAIRCVPSAPVRNGLFATDQIRVTIDSLVIPDTESPRAGMAGGFGVVFDVAGVDGIGFVSNRARLAVQMPFVLFPEPPPGAAPLELLPIVVFRELQETVLHAPGDFPPFLTRMNALLPEPDSIKWTDRPHVTGGNLPSLVGWSKQRPNDSSDPSFGSIPVTGLREDVLREDAARIFRSGIALGIAGAGAVALLQGILAAFLDRLRPRRKNSGVVVP